MNKALGQMRTTSPTRPLDVTPPAEDQVTMAIADIYSDGPGSHLQLQKAAPKQGQHIHLDLYPVIRLIGLEPNIGVDAKGQENLMYGRLLRLMWPHVAMSSWLSKPHRTFGHWGNGAQKHPKLLNPELLNS